jgi:N-acetylmuramoyl-L-alanine amidase
MGKPTWSLMTAARTLWQEARGEPEIGRAAVAHVLWNRLRSARWGTTLAGVCLWRAQFSGWLPSDPNFEAACGLADDDTVLLELLALLVRAETEPDPTNGATHYFASAMTIAPVWALRATYCGTFGRQRFYKNVD